MSFQNVDSQVLYRPDVGSSRVKLVVVLGTILGLIGSLMLAVVAPAVSHTPNRGTLQSIARPRASSHVPSTPTIRPTATPQPAPTLQPTAPPESNVLPITPFPTNLRSQIAVLQTNNRFLYHGNASVPEVALTFDDGPNPPYTSQILAILQQYSIKATFFCVGRLVAAYPDLVQQEYADGNVIGNHTWSHPNLPLLSSSDIVNQMGSTSDIISQTIAIRPVFFRPPYGALSAQVLTQANLLSFTTVVWNDDPQDWLRPGTNVIVARVLHVAGDGTIVILHDGGGDRSQTVAALPIIIESLQRRGYQFVTLQQMVDHLPTPPTANQGHLDTESAAITPASNITTTPITLFIAWRREENV